MKTYAELTRHAYHAAARLRSFVALAYDRRQGHDVRVALHVQRDHVVSSLTDLVVSLVARARITPLPAPVADRAQEVLLRAQVEVRLLGDGIPSLSALEDLAGGLEALADSLRASAPPATDETHLSTAVESAMVRVAQAVATAHSPA